MLSLILLAAITAAIVGSFISMLSYRLPIMLMRQWSDEPSSTETVNLALPSSYCPQCQQSIPWYRNIPIIGYFIGHRKCSHCQKPISLRYIAIELITVASFLTAIIAIIYGHSSYIINLHLPSPVAFIELLIILALVISLAVIDMEHGLLPDVLTLLLLWMGLLMSSLGAGIELTNAVWGAIAGYLLLWSIYWIMKWLTKKEGMGYGDFKYLAAIGAWVGWTMLPAVLLLASVSALFYAMMNILLKRSTLHSSIRFGPFLSASFYVLLVWGNSIRDLI